MEPPTVKSFYNNSVELAKSIEKKIDNNDETFEVLFTGSVIISTMVFIEIKRSSFRKGSDAYKNILENERELCCILTGNSCVKKWLEYIYKKRVLKRVQRFYIGFSYRYDFYDASKTSIILQEARC